MFLIYNIVSLFVYIVTKQNQTKILLTLLNLKFFLYIYIVNPNTQKPNVNAHHPHLPYPTKLVFYASYGSKRRSCVALVEEGTGTVMFMKGPRNVNGV